MKKSTKAKPAPWRAVVYLTEQERAAIEPRMAKDGHRTPTLWIAGQVRKMLAS